MQLELEQQSTKESQCKRVLAHLQSGKTLTARQASRYMDIDRLGARIFNLRSLGWKIKTELVLLPSKKRIAIYSLEKS